MLRTSLYVCAPVLAASSPRVALAQGTAPLNGTVIGVHRESPATEAKEAHDDSVAATRAAPPRAKPPE